MKRLILLGGPGSGKGTEAPKISAEYGIPHISTGDIFRANLKQGTPLGLKAKGYMDKGELVPDDLVIELVTDRLAQSDTGNGYILDGFPRTLPQAEALDKALAASGQKIDYVINLEVADDVLIKRMTSRRVCEKCGAIFNVISNPPKTEGICDLCGGAVIQRSDDSEETARDRIKVYEDQTLPLVGYYEKAGTLVKVDASGPADGVHEKVEALLAQ